MARRRRARAALAAWPRPGAESLRNGDRTVLDRDTALAASVGLDLPGTANKDQPYQYSKSSAHPLDDSGQGGGRRRTPT